MEALEAKGHSQESSQEPGPPGGSVPSSTSSRRAPVSPPRVLGALSESHPTSTRVCPRELFCLGRFSQEPPLVWLPGLPFSQLCSTSGKPKPPGQPQMLQAVRTILLSQVNGGKSAFPHLGTNLVPVALAGL